MQRAHSSPLRSALLCPALLCSSLLCCDFSGDDLSHPRNRSDPSALCTAVAQAKASHLLQSLPSSAPPRLLLTSDQVAYFAGEVREKPKDVQQCREWFAQYSSSPIRCVTAIVVTNTATRQVFKGVEHASQLYLPTPVDVLEKVIERGEILGCCGGFMVDDPELQPYLSTREGREDALMGMPSALLMRLLKEANESEAAGQKKQ